MSFEYTRGWGVGLKHRQFSWFRTLQSNFERNSDIFHFWQEMLALFRGIQIQLWALAVKI
jgi:hypothetical protein